MAGKSLNVEFTNMSDVINRINGLKEDSEKVIRSTMKDIASRAPSWVAQEVSKVYNIKKSEIKGNGQKGSAGSVRVVGTTVESYTLTYKGRPLTFSHFGQAPKVPKATGYSITVQVFKGQKMTVTGKSGGSGKPWLMNNGSGSYLAAQRMSTSRYPVQVLRTLSIPQMIDNEQVNDAIYKRIGEEGIKRLNHHVDRYFSKK